MLISYSAAPQVTADFTTLSSNTGCGSLIVEFQDLSTGNPDTWLWDFGNGNVSTLQNPAAVYSSAGIYDVSLTVSDINSNDTKFITAFIKVYPNPNVSISVLSSTAGCQPFNVDFVDATNYLSPPVSFQWNFGDGGQSNLQNPNYDYLSNGLYSVSLSVVDVNGCQGISTITDFIEVDLKPISSFVADINLSCDSNQLVNFSNSSIGATSYIWSFGDGSTSTISSPSHLYNTGTYSVELISKNSACSDTLVINSYIEVGSVLTTEFIADTSSGCQNLSVIFTDLSSNNFDTWFWDFGDGNTSNQQHPTHIYQNSGIYDVSLTVSSAGQCISEKKYLDFIDIFESPNIEILVDTSYGCSIPFDVNFNDVTSNAVSWDWDLGNSLSSNLQNVNTSYTSFGYHDIRLTVTNSLGCTAARNYSELINIENIHVDIALLETSGCLPFQTLFKDSVLSSRSITSWQWSFGDGSTSTLQNPIHQYDSTGTFSVLLQVKNDIGCIKDTLLVNFITVDEKPQINFSANPLLACAGEVIDFTDLSSSSSQISSWNWSFGDGSTSNLQQPSHVYNLSGSYDVKLVASVNNCSDTLVFNNFIEVADPTAFFLESYDCDNPLSVQFDNLSIGADNLTWDFGDGTTSNQLSPIHTFPSRGVYDVSVIATNNSSGCSHEFIKQIKITVPEANFSYLINSNNSLEDSVGCVPHQVYLKNLSQDANYYKVIWEDGYIGYGRVDHTFDTVGTFDVSMVITDIHGCKDTFSYSNMYTIKDVQVDFAINNVLGCDSMLVEFLDLTSPLSNVKWDFGDGNTSVANNPQHIYYNEGFYDVTVYANSIDGCKDTLRRIEYIQFQYPFSDFSTSNIKLCPKDTIKFLNNSIGIGLNYFWDFGDGNYSTDFNSSHSYLNNGFFNVNLTVTDSFGCENNKLLDSIRVEKPVALFTAGSISSNCPPLITTFNNQSTIDVDSWYWDFGDGGVSNLSSPSHLFDQSGIFDVSLIVMNDIGCMDTIIQNNFISISGPTGTFTLSDTLVCKDDSIFFQSNTINTSSYFWDFGDGFFSTDTIVQHSYVQTGVYSPSLIIQNSSGCQFVIESNSDIHIRQLSVDAGLNMEICLGEEIQLNSISVADSYNWSPSIGLSNDTAINPLANPIVSTTYTVFVSDGMCNARDSVFVLVYQDVPNPTFTTNNHCQGDITQFIASSGAISNNILWNWSFGANQQITNQIFPLGAHSVNLFVQNLDNLCYDSITQVFEIHPLPDANFSTDSVCQGEYIYFNDLSSSNVNYWNWEMGDGLIQSNLQNPSHLYPLAGSYLAKLSVISNEGCQDSIYKEVIVNHIPNANFISYDACEGERSILVDRSEVIGANLISWTYTFPDGSIDTNINSAYIFQEYGDYSVELSVVSDQGCESGIVSQVVVHPMPNIDFSIQNKCLGDITIFTDKTTLEHGIITQWDWSFGDNIGEADYQNPSYQYIEEDNYLISLTVSSDKGCEDSMNRYHRVYGLPVVNFDVSDTICLGSYILFEDISSSSFSEIISWEWQFGDGNFSDLQNPIHTYTYSNSFDVGLLVVSDQGCVKDTLIRDALNVYPNPIADFSASSLISSELNGAIDFYNHSEGANTYFWNFDNDSTSIAVHPSTIFTEVMSYEVSLTAFNEVGCENTSYKIVQIHPEFTFYIPNAFSPNGDGVNDTFFPNGNAYTSIEIIIYDRWGGVVYQSQEKDAEWEGVDSKGRVLPNGVYLYHISLLDYNGKNWVYNGELNLIK